MEVRNKKTQAIGFSSKFNVTGLGEIIIGFKDNGMDSDYISNYDVFLEARQEWKDTAQAFRDHDLITDNYNTIFFEPDNKEDKKRGYTLL